MVTVQTSNGLVVSLNFIYERRHRVSCKEHRHIRQSTLSMLCFSWHELLIATDYSGDFSAKVELIKIACPKGREWRSEKIVFGVIFICSNDGFRWLHRR